MLTGGEIPPVVTILRLQKGRAVPDCPSGGSRPDDPARLLQKTIPRVKGEIDLAPWHQFDGELGHQAAPPDVPDRPAEILVGELRYSTHDWQRHVEPGESALAEVCPGWRHEGFPRRIPAMAASRVISRAFRRSGLRTHAWAPAS